MPDERGTIQQATVPEHPEMFTDAGLFFFGLQNQRLITENQGVIMAAVDDLQVQLAAIQATETEEGTVLASLRADNMTLGTALQQIIQMLQAAPQVPDSLVEQAAQIAATALANTESAKAAGVEVSGLREQATGALPPTP